MKRRPKPAVRLRRDALSLLVAIVVPLVLFAVFPTEALRPLATRPKGELAAHCAFVTLTPEQESRAVETARTAWQLARGSQQPARIELFSDSLPALPASPVLDLSARRRVAHVDFDAYVTDLFPSTLAAPPPATFGPQPGADAVVPTFSREELLQLKHDNNP